MESTVSMVVSLQNHSVKRLTGNDWRDHFSIVCTHSYSVTNMHEYIGMSHGNKSKLAKIRVRREVFKGVKLFGEIN
jgi:hypothetical protein